MSAESALDGSVNDPYAEGRCKHFVGHDRCVLPPTKAGRCALHLGKGPGTHPIVADRGHRVIIENQTTGEADVAEVPPDDYLVICTGTCRVENAQVHGNGTVVLTIKGRKAALTAPQALKLDRSWREAAPTPCRITRQPDHLYCDTHGDIGWKPCPDQPVVTAPSTVGDDRAM